MPCRQTNTYNYVIQGTIDGAAFSGEFDFSTPVAFTGTIGDHPTAGRLSVVGASSSARLSEEGSAASNNDTVLVSVDANANGDGDSTADTEVPELPWSSILPQRIFNSLRED
jgi:hypothetical protein